MTVDIQSSVKSLLKAYTHLEWAEVTGYSIATLRQWSSQGHPAWKHRRWHPLPWIAWSMGLVGVRRRGRPRATDLAAEAREEALTNIIKLFKG